MMKRFQGIGWLGSLCAVMLAGVIGLKWLQEGEDAAYFPGKPKSLVTTLKGDARTSRAFTWYSEAGSYAEEKLQIVEGTDAGKLGGSDTLTYRAESSIVSIGSGGQNMAHQVEITDLKPGTTYVYRVGSGLAEGWSEAAMFTTEQLTAEGFTFINVADSQGETEADFELWGRTLDQAFAAFPDARFIVHNGDLTENPENEASWDYFFSKASKWLPSIPLMPVTGNHDEVNGEAGRYTSHFNLPNNGVVNSLPGTSYSFDYGDAHFTIMNTESNIASQTEWLRKDLQSTDKLWKIVAIHRPVYGGNSYSKIQEWAEVFDEFRVDLVLQGHNHEYSRSYPVHGGKVAASGEGTVYVTINTAGQKFNEKKKDRFYHAVHFQNGKQMFAGVTINGSTLIYQAYDVEGKLLDEFELEQFI